MSESDIKKLINNNMLIGAHSMSHHTSMLRTNEFKDEIDKSLDFINQFTNLKLFSYPYGSKISYNQKIVDHLEKEMFPEFCKCFKQKYHKIRYRI